MRLQPIYNEGGCFVIMSVSSDKQRKIGDFINIGEELWIIVEIRYNDSYSKSGYEWVIYDPETQRYRTYLARH
jgi:hypothetical protein